MAAEREVSLCRAIPGDFTVGVILRPHLNAEHGAALFRLLVKLRGLAQRGRPSTGAYQVATGLLSVIPQACVAPAPSCHIPP